MKKAGSIFIFFAFCFYSFVFKTHYCYYINTNFRFHGDCEHEVKDAAAKGTLAETNLFPKHYVCCDYFKDAKPSLSKLILVKNAFDNGAILPSTIQNTFTNSEPTDRMVPDVKNRGKPPLLIPNSFRGPPLI